MESMASFLNHISFFIIFSLTISDVCKLCNAKVIPLFFVFGDSLVDAGNNNYINTQAKADTVPNGIDFEPSGRRPTGRFTNGKTVTDLIGDGFGSTCYPPPYLGSESNETTITCGVNYASAAAGILNKTGYLAGIPGRINMDTQIDYFANTRQYLISNLGVDKAMELLKASFFPIIIGSNDFLANYLIPIVQYATRKFIAPDVYINELITRYKSQINRMHDLGVRKFLVVNVGPIGCIPYQREFNPVAEDGCVLESNQLAKAFNKQLKSLIIQLNSDLPDANLFYLNVYRIVSDLRKTHKNYGIDVIDYACCKVAGRYGGLFPCGNKSTYCPDRSKYFFWDPYHPSEAVNVLIFKRLLDGDLEDIYPKNIRQMIQYYM